MARHGIESPSVKYGLGAQDNDDKKQEELDNDDIETTPKRLKRQSTMAETAKEGAVFLQREGYSADSPDRTPADSSEEDQETPKVKRASTMEVTAKEGQEFLQRTGEINENELEEGSADTPSRPKLQRDSTIDVTVKEGEEFLRRSGALSEEGGDEISIGKDDEDDDDTRAQDEENNDECIPSLVRDTTMKETAKIGKQFVSEEGRAELQSQTAVLREAERESGTTKPHRAPLKRAGTMDVTKAEGEEFLKRKRT